MASLQQSARARFAAPRSTRSARLLYKRTDLLKGPLFGKRPFFISGGDRRLERREKHLRRGDGLVDAEHLEDLDVGRVVDSRDRLLHAEVSLGHLERDEVVLVVGGDCDHGIGALDAGLSEEADLAAVAAHDDAAELRLQPVGAPRILLDESDLMSALHEVTRQVIAHGAATDDDHVHTVLAALQQDVLNVLGALDGRADGVHAQLLVRLRALGVVDAGDYVRDLEHMLGDLRGHDVAVVALGHGDEAVGLLDAGATQDVDVGAVADHLVAAEVQGEHAAGGGAREGVGVAVDDHDLVARLVHVGRDLRANTTTPHDQQLQVRSIIGRPWSRPGRPRGRLLRFGRVRFPFTFMGLMALAMGGWAVTYLAGHPTLDAASWALAAATAVVCFGFAAYVLIRRVRRGPQH